MMSASFKQFFDRSQISITMRVNYSKIANYTTVGEEIRLPSTPLRWLRPLNEAD